VRLVDNLFCAFEMDKTGQGGSALGPISSWSIAVAPRALNGLLIPAPGFTGGAFCDRVSQTNSDAFTSYPFDPSLSLVDGARSLAGGASETVRFTVRITLRAAAAAKVTALTNKAWAGIFRTAPNNPGGQPTLAWATSSTAEAILADPSGVVYNALTRQPVLGAAVTLTRQSCQASTVTPIVATELYGDSSIYTFNPDGSVSVSTDAVGGYSFIFKVPPVNDLCAYSLNVAPPTGSGLLFPSSLIPAQSGDFASCGEVTAVNGAPVSGQDTTHYRRLSASIGG
jgi:hypothetical protein